MCTITVSYTSRDNVKITKVYKRLTWARKFAQKWIGTNPEIGGTYAISGDGIGKITAEGCPINDLFPAVAAPTVSTVDDIEGADAADGYGYYDGEPYDSAPCAAPLHTQAHWEELMGGCPF